MTLRAKIITTLIIVSICFLVGSFANETIASPFAMGGVVGIIGIWQLKNQYKKETSIQEKRRKNKIDAIIILSIIAVIILLLILKGVGVLNR